MPMALRLAHTVPSIAALAMLASACSSRRSVAGEHSATDAADSGTPAATPLVIEACHPPDDPGELGPSSLDGLPERCRSLGFPGLLRWTQPCEGHIVVTYPFVEECSYTWLFDAKTHDFEATISGCGNSPTLDCSTTLPDFQVPAKCFDGSLDEPDFVAACPGNTATADAGSEDGSN